MRDEILGLPVSDRDYVVVGATPEDMERLGFKPVGKDFPVFLHPETHEEYALARTERKVARGYKGFQVHAAPDVTLEQDLERRDLTINALARDEDGPAHRPLRRRSRPRARAAAARQPRVRRRPGAHPQGRAFRGALRLRGGAETLALMRAMVASGEADALVPERVWQEFSRGLMEGDPALMFAVLAEAGLLAKLLPELGLAFERGRPANDAARGSWSARSSAPQPSASASRRAIALVALSRAFSCKMARALSERLAGARANAAISRCSRIAHAADLRASLPGASAPDLLALLERCDAFRRPERFDELLAASRLCRARRARLGAGTVCAAGGTRSRAARVSRGRCGERSPRSAGKSDIAASIRDARIAAIEKDRLAMESRSDAAMLGRARSSQNLLAGARLALFLPVRALDFRVSAAQCFALVVSCLALWLALGVLRQGIPGNVDFGALTRGACLDSGPARRLSSGRAGCSATRGSPGVCGRVSGGRPGSPRRRHPRRSFSRIFPRSSPTRRLWIGRSSPGRSPCSSALNTFSPAGEAALRRSRSDCSSRFRGPSGNRSGRRPSGSPRATKPTRAEERLTQEEVFHRQGRLLDERLAALAPERRGVADSVFRRGRGGQRPGHLLLGGRLHQGAARRALRHRREVGRAREQPRIAHRGAYRHGEQPAGTRCAYLGNSIRHRRGYRSAPYRHARRQRLPAGASTSRRSSSISSRRARSRACSPTAASSGR